MRRREAPGWEDRNPAERFVAGLRHDVEHQMPDYGDRLHVAADSLLAETKLWFRAARLAAGEHAIGCRCAICAMLIPGRPIGEEASPINGLIARSSLGTRDAVAVRQRTPPETVERILDRVGGGALGCANGSKASENEGGEK